jgi:Tat protein secretion system quality control protein TatD with DNase activity
MVGEIGLCKMARFLRTYEHGKQDALALQRHVFVQQLQLAAVYQRPVSIHCVNQQGVLLDIFKEQQQQQQQNKKQLPPAMALHSFTGTAHEDRS